MKKIFLLATFGVAGILHAESAEAKNYNTDRQKSNSIFFIILFV